MERKNIKIIAAIIICGVTIYLALMSKWFTVMPKQEIFIPVALWLFLLGVFVGFLYEGPTQGMFPEKKFFIIEYLKVSNKTLFILLKEKANNVDPVFYKIVKFNNSTIENLKVGDTIRNVYGEIEKI